MLTRAGRATGKQARLSFLVRLVYHTTSKLLLPCRLLVMILSGNPSALCGFLRNLQEFVFPWNAVDAFVFSHNNAAAELLDCKNQVRTCDLAAAARSGDPKSGSDCISNDTNIFFLPLREEWKTPIEAGDSRNWQAQVSEEYRRMVCLGALLDM